MSVFVKRFSIVFSSILLILLGVDFIVVYYGLLSLPLLIALDLVVLGFLIMMRSIEEQTIEEKKFYLIWGLIMFDASFSISLGSFMGLVIGVAVFFIGLGVVLLSLALLHLL